MVAISKELFNKAVGNLSCETLLHPGEPRCTVALLDMIRVTLQGSAKYFFLMYLAQNALKYKTLYKDDIWPLLTGYVRSVVFGSYTISSCIAILCLYKNITGRFNRDVIAYWLGIMAGCGIYIDHPRRRPVVAYTISALAIEALIRRFYKRVKRSISREVAIFAVLNGILMYKMRVTDLARCSRDLWFFRPPKMTQAKEIVDAEMANTQRKTCPHAEPECIDYVMKDTFKYYTGAMAFTAIKLLLTKTKLRKNPLMFLKTMLQWNNMKLACFFGWYVGVFKAISCALCRWTKEDKAQHSLIAGTLAGLAYGLNSNITVLGSITLYVARIIGRELQCKYDLPKFHFVELSMMLGTMTLLNTRIFDPDCCPRGFTFIANTLTQLKLNSLFTQFTRLVEQELQNSS